MTQLNAYATRSRLETLALAMAQQRVDEVLTTPWQINGPRPEVLEPGRHEEDQLLLGSDPSNAAPGLKSEFTGTAMSVGAFRTTEVTRLDARRIRAVVTVRFTYRSQPCAVSLSTIRVTDNI